MSIAPNTDKVTEPDAPLVTAAQSEDEVGTSLWKDAWMRLKKNRIAFISGIVVIVIFLTCFLGPILLPEPPEDGADATGWFLPDPNKINLDNRSAGPSGAHLLGTDHLGRDLLSRVLDGGQISLLVALIATAVSSTIGILYGGISGYVGGRMDSLMMRSVDVLYALPFIVMVILFSLWVNTYTDSMTTWMADFLNSERQSVYRFTSLVPLFIAIGAIGWLNMARIVRAQVQGLRKQEFVEAARSLGLSNARILLRHILPNTLGPVIVYTTLTVPSIMLFEAILSFLGLGVQPPNSSWGILIKEGADRMEINAPLLIYPTIIFSLTLLCLNFLGDGLRDALDPKSAKD